MAERRLRGLSDEERDAWFGFLTVHSRVTRELDALLGAVHGMPLVEFEVLLKLSIAGGRMRMSDLAGVALLSRSGLTRIIDELESLGLVKREPDAHDGRVLLATLTPLGRRRFRAARESHLDNVRTLFLSRLTSAQCEALGESWASIIEGLDGGQPASRHRPRPRAAARR